jgi:hypothetical protein
MEALSHQSALSSGADLWVTAHPFESKITVKLDWYLNFQITKGLSHATHPIAENVRQILDKCELAELHFIDEQTQDLLISAQNLVPARWVLVVPFSTNWTASIFRHWQNLSKPKLRVFLPDQFQVKEFEKAWLSLGGPADVAFVSDLWIN